MITSPNKNRKQNGSKNPAQVLSDVYRNSMTKGVFLLPNLLTSLSLFAGFYSIINSINGKFFVAGWLIVISIVLDGIDGKVARLTNTSSKFGIEYDSLSDLVAFGVAPAILLFRWHLFIYGRLGWASVFVYMLGAALRLARFNVQVNSVEYKKFSGLPSPAAAGMVVSSVFFMESLNLNATATSAVMLGLMILTGLLMISNIGYFAMKDLSVFKRKPFEILVLFSLSIIVIIAKPGISFFVIFFLYTFISPILYFYKDNVKIRTNIKKQ